MYVVVLEEVEEELTQVCLFQHEGWGRTKKIPQESARIRTRWNANARKLHGSERRTRVCRDDEQHYFPRLHSTATAVAVYSRAARQKYSETCDFLAPLHVLVWVATKAHAMKFGSLGLALLVVRKSSQRRACVKCLVLFMYK
jgi:hypothetical protein